MRRYLLLLLLPLTLSACEELGIPDPEKRAAAALAEGRAIGGACRHAGRALEDCFALNPDAPKAAVFEGWRSMNDYMTENKIQAVKPEIPVKVPKTAEEIAHEKAAAEQEKQAAHDPEPAVESPLARLRARSQKEPEAH
ncbi:MAG: hypothetical protein KDG55_16460 [Rhodocyclaceae bacterium]|nr:hypothetical protein [Rhodocyclaceae bacterium]